jgi:hypothetical protein
MKRLAIEAGQRFGRLRIVRETARTVHPSGQTHRTFIVFCECGQRLAVPLGSLRSGNTVSCGCYSREVTSALKPGTRHGMSRTRTHKSWMSMHERVSGKYKKDTSNYQSRGITVCERWSVFENFLADMGERPKGKTLDRIDNDGNYEPGNCRWADNVTQGVNRRTTRFVMVGKERLCLLHAAGRLGVHYKTIIDYGERRGWSLQQSVDHYAARQLLAGVTSIHAP